jgi:site-specific recombinase XerC
MRDLNYQLKMLCKHSHEGSFETRVGRERQLSAIANQLHELGFRQLKATSLKQKHVQALVDHWLGQDLSPGTIKNRMSCLRWWAEKVNRRKRRRSQQRDLWNPGSPVRDAREQGKGP